MDWDVIGHEWAAKLLNARLAAGRVAHAYLFSGPPHVGKTRLALRLAQAVNCEAPGPPCGQCPSCRSIAHDTHPDVRVVRVETGATSLKIDQIRELQHQAALAPYSGRYRVFILRRMDLATLEAANSLLKTLEEPPRHVVLILTAVSAEALPPTVVSRCQRFDLRRAPLSQIEKTLLALGTEKEQAHDLAHLSGGQVGRALDMQRDSSLLEQRRQALDEMVGLLSEGRVKRLAVADRVSRDDKVCRELLELYASWWRDLLLVRAGAGGPHRDAHLVNVNRVAELAAMAPRLDLNQVYTMLVALSHTLDQIDANVNPRLAVEGLLLKMPHHTHRD